MQYSRYFNSRIFVECHLVYLCISNLPNIIESTILIVGSFTCFTKIINLTIIILRKTVFNKNNIFTKCICKKKNKLKSEIIGGNTNVFKL